MPLVILTGFPCSGLSYRAKQLSELFEKAQDELFESQDASSPVTLKSRFNVHIVPSHDSSNPRIVYDHARTEKQARGVAYARAKRNLTRNNIVILDGMNYIKGWRYQLWCEAKAAGTTCCVVHIGTPVDQCVAINNARLKRQASEKNPESEAESTPTDTSKTTDTEEPYPSDLLNNLIFRYEEPSTHSRWDKPLFTVPWADETPPIADIFHALTGIILPSAEAPPTTPMTDLTSSLENTNLSSAASVTTTRTSFTRSGRGGVPSRPKVVQHQATVQAISTDSGALYSMEKCTSAIVTAIRTFTLNTPSAELAVAQSSDGKGISIEVPESELKVFIPAHVATTATTDELAGAGGILALPKLQRLRRQWISLNRSYIGRRYGSGDGGLAADQIGDAFVRFLNSNFGGEDDDS
ncbi:hypothetical protein N7456_000503 [Penicillium angulare]|uniref:Chromatin associated protein KTI12 n=1 Tax=Penicillium angulare TaxID=116970 RepID=A0A9W9GD57_9EURO|nr:hypothetical protein N7456_000503 [Penicillium angulare]